ncbi:MAG: restriction endonuclease subunit S [Candidatus Bruticola sp.]
MKVRLGDICEIQSGGTPSRSKQEYWENGTIPWVKISDIKGKFVKSSEELITKLGLTNSSAKIFPSGTILYTIFATLGEVGILATSAATNQAIAGLQLIDDNFLRDYLFYYLLSKKQYVAKIGRGVAQNNINLSILKNFEIQCLNLQEQKSIVEALDKVSEIISLRKQQLTKLDELVKSREVEQNSEVAA